MRSSLSFGVKIVDIGEDLRGQRASRSRIENRSRAMLAAKLHRPRRRGDRNFQHRHHDRAFGDPALGRVHRGRVHKLVRAHVENDEILALLVEDDEADAGRALVAHSDDGSCRPPPRRRGRSRCPQACPSRSSPPAPNARQAAPSRRPGWTPCLRAPCRSRSRASSRRKSAISARAWSGRQRSFRRW